MVVTVAAEDAQVVNPRRPIVTLPTGFDGFFEREHASIVKALGLVLGDDHLGRDAASEGFVRALQKWRQVEGYDNPTGWVYRVGLNWALSRRRKTIREISERAATGRREPTTNLEPEDPRVLGALRRLSPEHRSVVVARYWFDWSEAEIAAALDVRPGTVKSRLSRALDCLADELGTR